MWMATHLEGTTMLSFWLLCCVVVSGWCLGGVDAAKPAGTPLVLGLGPGLVAVIVLGFVCVLICAVGYSAENKSRFLIPVIMIVGGTALFFASVKVDTHTETATQTPTKYNRVAITRSAIAALMIAFTVISGLAMLATHVLTHRQGRLIGDSMGRRSGSARVF